MPWSSFVSERYVGDQIRKLGLKWRFYMFATVYRSVSWNNKTLSIVSFAVEILATLFMVIYPISTYFLESARVGKDDKIFYGSEVLSLLTPSLFSTISAIAISDAYMIAVLLIFIYALLYPERLRRFHFLFLYPWHSFIYVLLVGVFGYCCSHMATEWDEKTPCCQASLLFIILFLVYTLFMCFLTHIQGIAIIRPDYVYAEWFGPMSATIPLFTLFVGLICFHCERFTNSYVKITIYVVEVIICTIIACSIVYKWPFMQFLVNDLMAAKVATFGAYAICSASVNATSRTSGWFMPAFPIMIFLVFIAVHLTSEARRRSSEKLLSQLGSTTDLSMDAIATTLESVRTETQMRNLIKIGMVTGKNAVLTNTFIRYCLARFPKSDWLISTIMFLYATVYGIDVSSYKFILHVLSLETFSHVPEYLMFQNIYCYMQIAEERSPIISRHLEEYRMNMLLLAKLHERFWLAETHGTQDVVEPMLTLASLINKQRKLLLDISAMFPLCPSVHYELSIWSVDFDYDYQKGAEHYELATSLINRGVETVTQKLFEPFSSFFPALKIDSPPKESDDSGFLTFLSMKDYHDRSRRHSVIFNTKDGYIKTITSAFQVPNKVPKIKPLFTSKMVWMWLTVGLVTAAYVILQLAHFYSGRTFPIAAKQYYDIQQYLTDCRLYREYLGSTLYILNLADSLYKGLYDNYLEAVPEYANENADPGEFMSFIIDHIRMVESDNIAFKHYFEEAAIQFPLDRFPKYVSDARNDTFVSYFINYHHMCVLYLICKDEGMLDLDPYRDEFRYSVQRLWEITNGLYMALMHFEIEYAKNTWIRDAPLLTSVIAFALLLFIVGAAALLLQFLSLELSMHSIIQTVQPPALRHIAGQFSKLLLFKNYQLPDFRRLRSGILGIVFLAISLLIIVATPATLTIYTRSHDLKVENVPSIPEIPKSDEYMIYVYGLSTFLEWHIKRGSNFTGYYNDSQASDIFGQDPMCVHNMWWSPSLPSLLNISLYEKLTPKTLEIVAISNIVLSAAFFGVFLGFTIRFVTVLEVTRKLLFSIPSKIAQSNPVLSKTRDGIPVLPSEVISFSDELKRIPDNFGFFATVFFEEDNTVKRCRGDVSKYLGIVPETREHLIAHLEDCATVLEGPEVQQFFEDRESSGTIYLTIDDHQTEFSLKFLNSTELFIKDETPSMIIHMKRRATNVINKTTEQMKIPVDVATSNMALLFISHVDDDHVEALNGLKEEYADIYKLQGRSGQYCFGSPCTEASNGAVIILAFVEKLSTVFPSFRCFCDIGDVLVANIGKSMVGKSRVTGARYDTGRMFTAMLNPSEKYVSKRFYETADMSTKELEFKEVSVIMGETMEVASL